MLGLHPGEQLVIPVRRYLCRACWSSTAVLPDELHPGRLYCGAAILISLWATLAQKVHRRRTPYDREHTPARGWGEPSSAGAVFGLESKWKFL